MKKFMCICNLTIIVRNMYEIFVATFHVIPGSWLCVLNESATCCSKNVLNINMNDD